MSPANPYRFALISLLGGPKLRAASCQWVSTISNMKYCSPFFGCFVPMHLTNNTPRSNIEPFLHNRTPLSAPNRFPSTLVCVVNTHQSEWKSSFSIRTGLRSGSTRGWMSTKMQTKLKTNGSSNEHYRASLMVQWLRICLAVQGTPVWSLIQEDPTCLRVINPGTTTTRQHSRACELQLRKPECPEKPLQWEALHTTWKQPLPHCK